MILTRPEGENMQSEANVRKVLDAVRKADPNLEDEVLSMVYDSMRWVLGEDHGTVEQFIASFVTDI